MPYRVRMRCTIFNHTLIILLVTTVACADDTGTAAAMQVGDEVTISDEVCAVAPPEPTNISVAYGQGQRPDGTVFYTASATSTLSTGDMGEANIMVAGDGSGRVSLAINGTIITQGEISVGEYNDDDVLMPPTVHTWTPTEQIYTGELIAELLQGETFAIMMNGMVPQAFKCSSFGRKAVRAGKYLFLAAVGAGAAACGLSTGALVPCGAAGMAAGAAISDGFEGYCE